MVEEKFIFLDFDDTLNDPILLYSQYVRELGAHLAPQFGGQADRWARTAIETLRGLETEYQSLFRGNPLGGYCDWLAAVHERCGALMFTGQNLPVPNDIATIMREAQFSALLQCNALFPGAAQALTDLYNAGCRLQMASGQESEFLMAALMGGGIESYTESKFGPDLVDCAKEGPEYYRRIFAAVGVEARNAVVVDDWPPAIGWALETGAMVIQSHLSRERRYEPIAGAVQLHELRDLPDAANRLFKSRSIAR